MIHTEEGSYEADDNTAMGAAQRSRSREELEARAIEREADESRHEWHDRIEMS
jgi:hypothetical protein